MDKIKALQNLLKGKATKKEIESLKQALASGEISIGGDKINLCYNSSHESARRDQTH